MWVKLRRQSSDAKGPCADGVHLAFQLKLLVYGIHQIEIGCLVGCVANQDLPRIRQGGKA